MDDESNVKISLISNGQQDILVSVNQSNPKPDTEHFDFTTRFLSGENFTEGKSLLLSMDELALINPACANLEFYESPCILYIAVYCRESKGCDSRINLEYENFRPKKALVG